MMFANALAASRGDVQSLQHKPSFPASSAKSGRWKSQTVVGPIGGSWFYEYMENWSFQGGVIGTLEESQINF